jgi:hypothetical protein
MKKMFVVMEVKDYPNYPNWVIPVDTNFGDGEHISKSRVIYANEMTDEYLFDGRKAFIFSRFSRMPPPEPEEEWERWLNDMPYAIEVRDSSVWIKWQRKLKNWLQKMPNRKI